jgi:hypothetical protein
MRFIKQTARFLGFLTATLIVFASSLVSAQETCSGEIDLDSTNYSARGTTGTTGSGTSSSTSYDASVGFITPNVPYLEMQVTGAAVDLGLLSDSTTTSGASQGGSCNCSFYVRSYLSSGYTVITVSQPPTSESGAVLDAKSVLGTPSANTNVEEFGINLVDNSSPNIGADPVNFPDSTFADGEAATGYSTVNQFKYAVGDTIARSPKTAGNQGVGQTNYTISYIAKQKTLTEAGNYTMNHVLVVVATY